MIDSDLEQRLERMYTGYARLPVDADASWRGFLRLRRRAAIRRRAIAAGAAVAVAVAATVASAVAYHRNGSEPSVSRHVNRPAHIGRLTITARIRQPGAGRGPGDAGIGGEVVAQSGQVWEVTYSGALFRIDQRGNRVAYHEHIAGLWDMTAGAGALWVLSKPAGSFGQLLKLDPGTGRVTARFPLARRCQQVTYGGSQLWLACGTGTTDFLRINPVTGRVIAVAGPAHGVAQVAATPAGIWYAGNSGVSGFVGLGQHPHWVNANDPADLSNSDSLIFADRAIWAFDGGESVAKIDPLNGRIVRVYNSARYDPTGTFGLDFFTVGQGSLWFLNDDRYEATSVLRVSLASGLPQGQVSRVGSCGEPCWQIYQAGGSVWVPTQTHVTRIDPVTHPLGRRGNR